MVAVMVQIDVDYDFSPWLISGWLIVAVMVQIDGDELC